MDVSIVFWLVIGAITVAAHYFHNRLSEKKTELLQTFVDKGQPIPPELLVAGRTLYDHRAFTVGGIILLAIGAAAAMFFWSMSSGTFGKATGPTWLPFLSVFPFCIGGACLFVARYLRRHE